jgi:hypothetical protein
MLPVVLQFYEKWSVIMKETNKLQLSAKRPEKRKFDIGGT